MKKGLWIFIVLFMLSGVITTFGDERKEYPVDMEKLKAGKHEVFLDDYRVKGVGQKKMLVGIIMINHSPEVAWEVLKDWDTMGEYVPGLKYYKTIHSIAPPGDKGVGISLVEGQLKIPLVTIQYSLEATFNKPEKYKIGWHLLSKKDREAYKKQNIAIKKHTTGIKHIEGFSTMEPYDNWTKTIYTYRTLIESSIPVPAFIERFLLKITLKGYFNSLRERIDLSARGLI